MVKITATRFDDPTVNVVRLDADGRWIGDLVFDSCAARDEALSALSSVVGRGDRPARQVDARAAYPEA